jgi:hypothetical protein
MVPSVSLVRVVVDVELDRTHAPLEHGRTGHAGLEAQVDRAVGRLPKGDVDLRLEVGIGFVEIPGLRVEDEVARGRTGQRGLFIDPSFTIGDRGHTRLAPARRADQRLGHAGIAAEGDRGRGIFVADDRHATGQQDRRRLVFLAAQDLLLVLSHLVQEVETLALCQRIGSGQRLARAALAKLARINPVLRLDIGRRIAFGLKALVLHHVARAEGAHIGRDAQIVEHAIPLDVGRVERDSGPAEVKRPQELAGNAERLDHSDQLRRGKGVE